MRRIPLSSLWLWIPTLYVRRALNVRMRRLIGKSGKRR